MFCFKTLDLSTYLRHVDSGLGSAGLKDLVTSKFLQADGKSLVTMPGTNNTCSLLESGRLFSKHFSGVVSLSPYNQV